MLRSKSFGIVRAVALLAVAAALSGCASDGTSLDGALGLDGGNSGLGALNNLNLGSPGGVSGASSLPSTDAYVRQQLERRGL